MPGPWKPWKTKLRFPTVPTAPWKSPKTRFPHSHSTDDGSYIPIANNARAFQALTIEGENQKKGAIRSCPPGVEKAFHFRAHPALESKSSFRLIPRWNEFSISGSFVDWKRLLSLV